MSAIFAPAPAACSACGFSTRDLHLLASHSCDTQVNGGRCEDFPCCGHEAGDCNGALYGSDAAIRAEVEADYYGGHGYCDHEYGIFQCDDQDDDDPETCDHSDFSYTPVERDGVSMMENRRCDRCYSDLPDRPEE